MLNNIWGFVKYKHIYNVLCNICYKPCNTILIYDCIIGYGAFLTSACWPGEYLMLNTIFIYLNLVLSYCSILCTI